MSLERCYSLRTAARVLGCDRTTLKRWLLSDLGLALPPIGRGSRLMIRGSDLERLANLRGCQVNWSEVLGSRGRIRVLPESFQRGVVQQKQEPRAAGSSSRHTGAGRPPAQLVPSERSA
jgi:hypothetical protein